MRNTAATNAAHRSDGHEDLDKSPRKIILINTPNGVCSKGPVAWRENGTEESRKMKTKIVVVERCIKPMRTKPTKSLWQQLASGRKFKFATGTVCNPRKKNRAATKERLAQLSRHKRDVDVADPSTS
ncbi:unnamed protein product [Hermetia illucens]|uniref:Uncharacterized protein n=1 Tax=Hermetia illucens TaxID=343691 RepID=A0A7R8UYP6_HERIL|nr:unnamed protein product [Hermetia illucens]